MSLTESLKPMDVDTDGQSEKSDIDSDAFSDIEISMLENAEKIMLDIASKQTNSNSQISEITQQDITTSPQTSPHIKPKRAKKSQKSTSASKPTSKGKSKQNTEKKKPRRLFLTKKGVD